MKHLSLNLSLLLLLLGACQVTSFVYPRQPKGFSVQRLPQTSLAAAKKGGAKKGKTTKAKTAKAKSKSKAKRAKSKTAKSKTAKAKVAKAAAVTAVASGPSAIFSPSKVIDEDGPTPEDIYSEPEVISVEDVPEFHYDPDAHQVPHQPWRRGMTDGCEDSIEVDWRKEAEDIIYKSADFVGGKVLDVTWYLTRCVITIDDDLSGVDQYSMGPEIQVKMPDDGPEYIDPEETKVEPIWADEETYLYERDEEEEKREKEKMYAPKDVDDEEEGDFPDEDDEVPLFATEETREDMAAMSIEEEVRIENEQRPLDIEAIKVDTPALSTIARAILEALEEEDDRLEVLERHEIILASPSEPGYLETQRQFDDFRGYPVAVETVDPWNSNRVLKGTLEDRNSMDVIINKKGRMVTIPQNFVKCVRLLNMKDDEDLDFDEDDLGEEG